jgi:hypothetical protein
MDDIQCPASLPRRHRVAFDDPLHADDEIRVATIQQIDPLMTVRDQPAQLLVLGITFARDEMVDRIGELGRHHGYSGVCCGAPA